MEIDENLVRENGNQAAAVMADYAGGGGREDFIVNSDNYRKLTEEDRAKLPNITYDEDKCYDLQGALPIVFDTGQFLLYLAECGRNPTIGYDIRFYSAGGGTNRYFKADEDFTIMAPVYND